MPRLYTKHGRAEREVNFGWLLRHAGSVERIEVNPLSGDWREHGPVAMLATLTDRQEFLAHFTGAAICRKWLRRPLFRGVPLVWNGLRTTCDASVD